MKKLLIPFLIALPAINACSMPAPSSTPVAAYPYPSAAPTTSTPFDSALNNLKAGVLPGTTLSEEEKSLAEVMSRKIAPIFPLRIGVLLYKPAMTAEDKIRQDNYNKFIEKLRSNPNIELVQDIPNSLAGTSTNIEELRKLAARFQVTNLLIINDSSQSARENKNAVLTPIDIVTGMRNWETTSLVEIFSLDVLNGVFVSTVRSNITLTEKYNRNSVNENKENALTIKAVNTSWDEIISKTEAKIEEFKKQAGK